MNTKDILLEKLVSNPEEIKDFFFFFDTLYKHVHFGLQINIDNRNGLNQSILYDCLLMFLTHLPDNYTGMNQNLEEYKNKIGFFLPKKAFRQYVNESLKSYTLKKVEDKLSVLGKNKVATQHGVVVDLFTMFQFDGLDDFWGLLFDVSTIPYVSTPAITLMLALTKVIPFIPTSTLELSEMVEERLKAGLEIPVMMYVMNNTEFTKPDGDFSDNLHDEHLQQEETAHTEYFN